MKHKIKTRKSNESAWLHHESRNLIKNGTRYRVPFLLPFFGFMFVFSGPFPCVFFTDAMLTSDDGAVFLVEIFGFGCAAFGAIAVALFGAVFFDTGVAADEVVQCVKIYGAGFVVTYGADRVVRFFSCWPTGSFAVANDRVVRNVIQAHFCHPLSFPK